MTAPARNLPARQSQADTDTQSVASIGTLPPDLQHALALRKMRNQVAGQLASQNWGKNLDLETRRAIADWGQQFRVDVTTEIHVLGGNVYLNAAFALRKLSELIEAGVVEYAYADHVEDDPRLKALGPEGEGEYSRRLRERIMHNLPDKAASAVVFRIKLRTMDKEVTGAKACGNGVKKNDPVGDAAPVETSESRAARRAMRMIASHVPRPVADEFERVEASAQVLTDRVRAAREQFKVSEAAARINPRPLPAVSSGDPYSADVTDIASPHEAPRVTPGPRTEAHRAASEAAANVRDPFEVDPGAYLMPFAQGRAKSGTPLRDVSNEDLTNALRFASAEPKYEAFCDMAKTELDDRRIAANEPDDEERDQ